MACKNIDTSSVYTLLEKFARIGNNDKEQDNNDKERRRESDNISKIGYAAVIGDVSLYFALGVNYNVSL